MSTQTLEAGATTAPEMTVTTPSEREIVLTRSFDASRELVWEACSRPEHLRRWWGVWGGTTMTVCEVDFRTGGAWRFVLRGQDGEEWGFRGEFREIEPPARMVQTFEYEGMPGHISVETLDFDERDGITTVTNTCRFSTVEERDAMLDSDMADGAAKSFDSLEVLLADLSAQSDDANGEPELRITRLLNAPRELVWQAWTQREHLARWCAPHGADIIHCDGDLRVGGAWRTGMKSPEWGECWVGGEYREIMPPRRLVFTHVWDDNDRPGHETLVTVTLEEQNGQTKMTFQQTGFAAASSRDGHETGWTESFERLDTHLRQTQETNGQKEMP